MVSAKASHQIKMHVYMSKGVGRVQAEGQQYLIL